MGGPPKLPPSSGTFRGPEDFAALFDVSRETLERLQLYEQVLRQWQKAINLVAPGTQKQIWHRHFADSAQLLALAPPGPHHWIDLGSGGGFPGLVIAILLADKGPLGSRDAETTCSPPPCGEGLGVGGTPTSDVLESPPPCPSPARGEGTLTAGERPTSRVTLIESDTRKAAFLRDVARQTAIPAGVSVDILSTRAESARIEVNGSLPRVICARALAPLDRLLGLAAPLSPPGTTGLYLKGKGVPQELQAAEKIWNFNVELVPSVTDRDGRIAVITHLDRKAKD